MANCSMAMSQTLTSVWNGVWPCNTNIALGGGDIYMYDCFNFLINHRILSINVSKFQTTPTQTCKCCVYVSLGPRPKPTPAWIAIRAGVGLGLGPRLVSTVFMYVFLG